MKRKNKTITTTQIKPLIKKKLMRSVTIEDQSITQNSQLDVTSIARQFVEEFIDIACQHIHCQEMIHMNISKFTQGFTIIQGGYYGLSPSEHEVPQFTPCENEPQPTTQAYNCKIVQENKQNQSILRTNESRMRISKCSIKSKSKSEEQKYINLHHVKKSQLKQKRSVALLPLINFNRHSQDNSSDIQELMRRKKELQLHTCKTQRLSTNLSKISFQRKKQKQKEKEKYFYYQNDQGDAKKVKINTKQKQYQQGIATAKYEPGSTLYEGIKKKPIAELISTRKRRKRKNQKTNTGDTCLLVQKMTELQLRHSHDILQKLLQKGVNLNPKEDHSNDERYSQKLPTFR